MELMNQTVLTGKIKKESHNGKLLAALFVLVGIGAAFFFSAQPASISKLQSGSILEIFKAFGFENVTMHLVRKMAHFVLFGSIGAAFTFAFSFKVIGTKLFSYSFFATVLMAIIDETHQMFVPGRGPQVKDVMIDSAGALLGVMVIATIITVYKKRKLAS
ncbi:MAG: VanZ family protein [Clostridiales bacterium]|nr:VanZ family protein [Clostridiales bacterium]